MAWSPDRSHTDMVQTDAIEGIRDDAYRFHYHLAADVLYPRRLTTEDLATVADLTDDGDLVLLDEQSNRPVGLTVVSFWKRFGQGPLPDSLVQIQSCIQPLAARLAA
jgi:hypothetical protein